jgi:epoxyqueuosine reductase
MVSGLTQAMNEFASAQGVDLIGVAPVERFEGIAPDHHPASVFPETKSVIVLGKRITRGCLRGVEEGTQMELYRNYATSWVPNQFLASMTVAVATFLEDQGWESVPMPDLPPEVPALGIPVAADRPAANVMVDFIDAAVRAGLGEISLMGELLTPEFGTLQRLQIILSDATLDPTPIFDGNLCDQCGACAKACPLQAVDAAQVAEFDICGKPTATATIHNALCEQCKNGAFLNPYHSTGRPDRLAASCNRACLIHLEEADKLKQKFHNAFRQRPAWKIDRSGFAATEEG